MLGATADPYIWLMCSSMYIDVLLIHISLPEFLDLFLLGMIAPNCHKQAVFPDPECYCYYFFFDNPEWLTPYNHGAVLKVSE